MDMIMASIIAGPELHIHTLLHKHFSGLELLWEQNEYLLLDGRSQTATVCCVINRLRDNNTLGSIYDRHE